MSNNEYHKDTCLKDIRLRAQKTLTNISSIVNSMRRGMGVYIVYDLLVIMAHC